MFGLPQRGKGAEVAEIESILCTLCGRVEGLSDFQTTRRWGRKRFLEISSEDVMDQMSSRAKKEAKLN